MALRLRRGTDAERQIITPLQGELIYATDTKKLYIGDGSTAGGVLVGPTEADQFTELVGDTSPQLGGDLDLNGNSITGTGNINIDGTITATGNIGLGDDVSDVINVGGVINSSLKPAIDGGYDLGSDIRRWNTLHAEGAEITGQLSADSIAVTTIIGADSSVLYDNNTDTLTVSTLDANTVNANLVGNVTGNVSGDVNSVGTSTFNNAEIDNATITSGQMDGVVIGGDNLIPLQNITGRIITASNGFVGNLEGQLIGNVNGDVYGSLQGSVFAGDSSIIIDSATSSFVGRINTETKATIDTRAEDGPALELITDGGQGGIEFFSKYIASSQTGANLKLYSHNGTYESPTPIAAGETLGQINLGGHLAVPGATIDLAPVVVKGTLVAESNGVDSFPVAKLELVVLNGPNPADAARASLDHVGTFSSPVIQPGTYADATARDAAITSPAAGMMVFLTDGDGAGNPKFQGYDGSAWVNLN
jgi:hypothetical protein